MSTKEQDSKLNPTDYSEDERLAIKYKFLREKILFHFERGSRYLKIAKITATVVFLVYTVIGIVVSHHTSHEMQWLQMWILFLFLNVTVFIIADYSKYLVESKVIPYLKNDDEIEFGEYDIFLEDIDGESDDEDEEEDEED